ncbi:MAG: isocitrate/isopropylmalate dehydrogenase family protein [Actinobacteria bacterium]|nr:isocitrate/isopropylmalate dehydrogenase family protein [Actinomycetota bacterium]
MRQRIGVMLGDGIGAEIVPQAVAVMEAAVAPEPDVDLELHPFPVGWSSYLDQGHTLPSTTLEGLAAMDGFVLGPIGHAQYPKDRPECVNPHPIIRKHFDLFANLRPAQSRHASSPLHDDVDLLVVRENNEGFQPDRNMVAGCGEFQPNEDAAFSIRVITRRQSERIARAAFEAARRRDGKRRVTAIHKRSVFKLTDGVFMDAVERVAKDYPDIAFDDYQVDTFAMHLVMRPQDFDVILCTNLFGDILSDEAAGLVGGLGMAPGLNTGDDYAMAQATHGSAPDIAGKGVANPYAMIVSTKMLLEWLGAEGSHDGLTRAARRIDRAVEHTIADGRHLTPDIGGSASTHDMGSAIADACSHVSLEADRKG